VIIDLIRRARDTGDVQALVDAIPYSRFLGLSVELRGEDLVGKMTFREHLVGNSMLPALHGGTLGALLESTSIFTLLLGAETLVLPKIINLTVEYLRSGKAVDTYARAELTKVGRKVANVRAVAWQEDPAKPIAAAHAHFLLRPGS
jgi:acyl-coenzyme A thioesterase PaaI-like protein